MKPRIPTGFLCWFLLFAAGTVARAQQISAESAALHHVRGLLPEPGVLWAATGSGLLRWDLGESPPQSSRLTPVRSGLQAWDLTALARAPASDQRALWIGSRQQGLARFDGTSWSVFTKDNSAGLASDAILCLAPDAPRKRLWAALDEPAGSSHRPAVAYFDFTTRKFSSPRLPAPATPATRVTDLHLDAQGTLWIATDAGAFIYFGQSFRLYTPPQAFPAGTVLSSVVVDRQGRPWFGTRAGGVLRVETTGTVRLTTANGLPGDDIADLTLDATGRLWALSSSGGPAAFDGIRFVPPDPAPVAQEWTTAAANPTLDIGVWFGTEDRGQLQVPGPGSGGSFLDVGTTPGCTDITAVVRDLSNGDLWAGCKNGGLNRFDGTQWHTFREPEIPNDAISSAAFEAPDSLWFGTRGGGVLRRQGGLFTTFDSASGVPPFITAVAVDPRTGEKWFGTSDQAACRFTGQQCAPFTEADGLPSSAIRDIDIAPNGDVWFATPAGLSLYDGTSVTSILSGDPNQPGDFAGKPFPADFVRIQAAPDGSQVCAASSTAGVACLQQQARAIGDWRSLDTFDGMPSNTVLSLGYDADAVLWAGTDRGLAMVADGLVLDRIDLEDGLPDEVIQEVFPDPDPQPRGLVLLGTPDAGLVTLNQRYAPRLFLRPTLTDEIACSSVTLRWDAFAGMGFQGYRVLRAELPSLGAPGVAVVLVPAAAALFALAAGRGRRRWFLTAAAASLCVLTPLSARQEPVFSELTVLTRRNVLAYTDSSAEDARSYRYRVDVLTRDGKVTGAPLDVAPHGRTPAAPALRLGPGGVTLSSVTLAWPPPAVAGPCPAAALQLYSEQGGTFQPLGPQQAAAAGMFTDSPLVPGTRQRYVLRAINAAGESPGSPLLDVTTAPPDGPLLCRPAPPHSLRAQPMGKDRVLLRWVGRSPADADCPAQGFAVYRLLGQTRTLVQRVGGGKTRLVDHGSLAPGTSYRYVARSVGSGGESDDSEDTQVTTPPDSASVAVPGSRARVPTGILLQAGDPFAVHWLRGQVRFNTYCSLELCPGVSVDADGLNRADYISGAWPADTGETLPGVGADPLLDTEAGHAGLMGELSLHRFYIGEGRCLEAPRAGELMVGVNDGSLTAPAQVANPPDDAFQVEVALLDRCP